MVTDIPYHEEQRLIDEEIAALRAQAQQAESLLVARRNAYAPAAKLPNEVLVDIFLLSRDSSEPGTRDWLQVCQICRHWRHVAVGAASLWTQIYARSHAFMVLMLKRSQQAPLEVHFSHRKWSHGSNPVETVITAMSEIPRIRTLSFIEQAPNILEAAQVVLGHLRRDATMLEDLTVHIRDVASGHRLVFALEVFRPANGHLRNLSLSNLQFADWDMLLPVASGLKKLILSEVDTAVPVSGARFTEVLRQMINLEELLLSFDDLQLHQYTAPTSRTPAAVRLKPIELPWLKSLHVRSRSRLEQVEAFLVHASYPRLQNLSINCGDSENPGDYASIICAIAHSIRKGDFGTPKVLQVFGSRLTVSPALGRGKPFVDVFLPLTADVRGDENDVAIVADILTCFVPQSHPNCDTVSSLRNLYLGNLLLAADDFIHLFGHLPHLESIEVFGELALVLFEALAVTSIPAAPDDQNPAPNMPIAFSKLQTITWQRMVDYVQDNQIKAVVFDALYGCLLARRERGVGISKLDLVGTKSLDIYQADKLKDIVSSVISSVVGLGLRINNFSSYSQDTLNVVLNLHHYVQQGCLATTIQSLDRKSYNLKLGTIHRSVRLPPLIKPVQVSLQTRPNTSTEESLKIMDTAVPFFEAQRTLGEEIAALRARTQNSLTLLQARRNAIAPVSRLPSEILVEIFLILRNWWKSSIKGWHHVTQICRHWRHVAIEAPILWTNIFVLSHEYTPMMLERSQNAPLDVEFINTHFSRRNPTIATLSAILNEIERIRTLSFTETPIDFLETAQIFLRSQGRQALILESLNIECSESGLGWFKISLGSFRPTIPLRQLSVMSVQIDWSMLPITNLIHMRFVEVRTPVEVTGAQLVDAIRQMANLEELSMALDDIRLCHYGPNFQPIHLSHLKSLSVYPGSDRQDQIRFFLSHIMHPKWITCWFIA